MSTPVSKILFSDRGTSSSNFRQCGLVSVVGLEDGDYWDTAWSNQLSLVGIFALIGETECTVIAGGNESLAVTDLIARDHNIRSLTFTGCTTSVCVQSTLRDAFYRNYLVEARFGWTAEFVDLLAALSAHAIVSDDVVRSGGSR